MERDVEKRLNKGVADRGGKSFKWVSPGNAGVPDRIVIVPPGRVIFVELKEAGGRLSAQQKAQIRRLKLMGCDVRVLVGDQEVDVFLNELDYMAGDAYEV